MNPDFCLVVMEFNGKAGTVHSSLPLKFCPVFPSTVKPLFNELLGD
jgi:hypothetical protein